MTAFRRRTAFAAPVIITLSAGCSSKDVPRAKVFPGEHWQVEMRDMKCYASVIAPNPPPRGGPSGQGVADPHFVRTGDRSNALGPQPREIECPPGMSGRTVMTVGVVGSGECAVVPQGCTDVSCATLRTPCPLPFGKSVVHTLANLWKIEKRGALCHAESAGDECPPGVDCNPPAPRQFPCPAGVDEEHERIIAEMPDATCVIVPDGCTDTSCATVKTDCPPK